MKIKEVLGLLEDIPAIRKNQEEILRGISILSERFFEIEKKLILNPPNVIKPENLIPTRGIRTLSSLISEAQAIDLKEYQKKKAEEKRVGAIK
jgi:hypothetical protein